MATIEAVYAALVNGSGRTTHDDRPASLADASGQRPLAGTEHAPPAPDFEQPVAGAMPLDPTAVLAAGHPYTAPSMPIDDPATATEPVTTPEMNAQVPPTFEPDSAPLRTASRNLRTTGAALGHAVRGAMTARRQNPPPRATTPVQPNPIAQAFPKARLNSATERDSVTQARWTTPPNSTTPAGPDQAAQPVPIAQAIPIVAPARTTQPPAVAPTRTVGPPPTAEDPAPGSASEPAPITNAPTVGIPRATLQNPRRGKRTRTADQPPAKPRPLQPGLELQPMVHVDDMAAAISFYEKLGGAVNHGDRDSDWVLMQVGTSQIGLVTRPPDAARGESTVELNFSAVMPLDRLERLLVERGVTVIGRAFDGDLGVRLHLETPEGMPVRIHQVEPDLLV